MFVAGIDAHATYSVIAIVSNTGQLVAGPIRIKKSITASGGLTKNSSSFSTPTVTQDVTQSVNHQLAPLCQPSGALFTYVSEWPSPTAPGSYPLVAGG